MRRFDETFFIDLPKYEERKDIFRALLGRYKRNASDFNINALANASEQYSGSEIEKGIVSALFAGFSESQRTISTDDILLSLKAFKPLYLMREESLKEMRDWATISCVPASSECVIKNIKEESEGGAIDLLDI